MAFDVFPCTIVVDFAPPASGGPSNDPLRSSRLNLLLSSASWRREAWPEQLPRLLDPLGVRSICVDSGRRAEEVLRTTPVHIAVIDLSIPLDASSESSRREEAGPRMLRLLRGLDPTPPVVVVRNAAPTERDRARSLSAALREGAFAVLDRPVQMELMLEIMRRIFRRYYKDVWPSA